MSQKMQISKSPYLNYIGKNLEKWLWPNQYTITVFAWRERGRLQNSFSSGLRFEWSTSWIKVCIVNATPLS
jgi:hypothetical protein